MQETKPLILVDGSTYLFRAFYAVPDLKTSTGEYTGAIRGVISMLLKLGRDFEGSPIAVVFDMPGKTFRDEIFSEYKANRPPMQDEMAQQIQPIHEIIKCMGLPLIMKDGFEADDIIGTLATQATEKGLRTIISTSDKDMAQLVNDHVTMLDTMKNEAMDRDGVIEKFGVPPDRIIDYLALMGDKVDNIPGVPKVGPKTAAKWLNAYGSLDDVVARSDEIKGKVGENLRAAIPDLPLSRTLTTIKCDVALDVTVDDLMPNEMDIPALVEWFNRFEFRTLLRQITEDVETPEQEGTDSGFEFISDPVTLEVWVDAIKQAGQVSLSILTEDGDGYRNTLVGVALCTATDRAAYVPVSHSDEEFRQLDSETVLRQLKPVLEDEAIATVGNNLKPTINFFSRNDIQVNGRLIDTMLMSYVVNSVVSGGHHVSALAMRHLNRSTKDRAVLTGTGNSRIPFSHVPIPDATMYMAEVAQTNMRVVPLLQKELQVDPRLLAVYEEIEEPVSRVLGKMERDGVCLNPAVLHDLSRELDVRIRSLTASAFEYAGENFGLGSPKQLSVILYDKLNLPAPRKTRTGNRSTSEDVLRDLIDQHPLPQIILDYRAATKLKSTYSDQLGHYVNRVTKRVHTTYDQANTTTGRLASGGPNLQNIPIRTPDGRRIREAFIAPEGYVLMAADYSQIELRIMAHLSEDQSLQDAFNEGLDIHAATASDVFNTPYEQVDEDMRRNAKAINFGLMYGMSPFGLARNLGINQEEASEYIETYFDNYPGVRTYMDETKSKARADSFVETLFGRRIYLDEIHSRHYPRRQGAERLAINAPVQGSAADIIKRATVIVDDFLTTSQIDAKMVLHVHDEIVFEVQKDQVDELQDGVVKAMSSAAELAVKLDVDVGVGANWSEAH